MFKTNMWSPCKKKEKKRPKTQDTNNTQQWQSYVQVSEAAAPALEKLLKIFFGGDLD
jgi:hypothetical protein